MKSLWRIRILLHVSILLLCIIPQISLASISAVKSTQYFEEGPYWYTISNGTATITGFDTGKAYDEYHLAIPSALGGFPVVEIGEGAFPGDCLFGIVNIPDTVKRIDSYAFAANEFTSVTLPNQVQYIGAGAFEGNLGLVKISLPATVTYIGRGAFGQNYSMKSIEVASGNTHYSSQDGTLYNKDKTILISYPPAKGAGFIIPSTVKTIADEALSGYAGRTINIPNSVTKIGSGAFIESGIEEIAIPNSMTEIIDGAFSFARVLEKITIPSSVMKIGENALDTASVLNGTITIYGYTGSYAETYALKSKIAFKSIGVVPATSLSISSVKPDKTSTATGTPITWTASAKGGSGTKTYRFQLIKDGKEVVNGKYGSSNTYKYTPTEAGKYKVKVYVKDDTGTVSSTSSEVTVKSTLAISSIKADTTSAKIGTSITWTASAKGGSGTKTYRFQIFKDGKSIVSGKYGTSKSLKYTPTAPGDYKVKLYVKDKSGTVDKISSVVKVTFLALKIKEIDANNTSVKVGTTMKWSVVANGGYGTKTYCFVLYKDGKEIAKGKYSSSKAYEYTPTAKGKYNVKVYVKDSSGSISKNSSIVIVK